MKSKFSSIWRVSIALVMALSLGLIMAAPVSAVVGITTADADVDADTFISGLYTDLPAIVIAESAFGEIDIGAGGTIILNAPTGFVFRTTSEPDVAVTGAGEMVAVFTSITTTELTVTVTTPSTSAPNTLTIGEVTAIGVKPSQGTPLASGDIVMDALSLAVIDGVTVDDTSFGTLTEVPGVATQLAYTEEPGTVVAGVETDLFTVERRDQFTNPTTSGETAVGLASDSTGAAKKFTAITPDGDAVTEVTIADAASTADFYYYDEKAGAWTITASATGLTSAESALTVNPEALAAYTVVPAALTQTAGTPFDVVITAVDQFENPLGAAYATDPDYIWTTSAGGTPDISEPLLAGDFGVVGFATKAVTLDAIEAGVTFTATDNSAIIGTSEGVEVVAGPEAYLAVTGDPTMTAGGTNELTITAYDAADNVATSYTGSKTLVFSGPGVAPDATAPTVEGVTMENETTVTFTAGVSSGTNATLIAYNAEGTTVDVTDGTVHSTGDVAHDLDLTVDPAAAAQLAYTLAPATVVAGVETTEFTVERQDQYANPVISGETIVGLASDSTGIAKKFMATSGGDAVTEVTILDTFSAVDFYYDDEKAGDWTLTASATGLTSAESALTVGPAAIDHYSVAAITSPQVTGDAFSVTIQAQDVFNNDFTSGVNEAEDITISYSVIDGLATPEGLGAATTAAGAATVEVSLTEITLGQSITFLGEVSGAEGTSNPFQVVAVGAIDHYAVTTTIGDQDVGVVFEVIIQAQDASNNDITLGTEAAEAITITFGLTDTGATWTSPVTTSAGTKTVSDMNMSVAQVGQTIIVTGDVSGVSGTSNSFTVYDDFLTLPDDWTLTSIDKWLNTTGSAWIDEPVQVLKYTSTGFLDATLADGDLEPVEALYVQMDGAGDLGIIYSTAVQGMSDKDLVAGWNLISSATSVVDNADDVLSPLQDVGSLGVGLTTLVSQTIYNQNTGDLYIDASTWTNLATVDLNAFDGYWIYMNAAKSFGVIPD